MTYICKAEKDTDVENEYIDTKEEGGGWKELGDWDWHIYTTDAM